MAINPQLLMMLMHQAPMLLKGIQDQVSYFKHGDPELAMDIGKDNIDESTVAPNIFEALNRNYDPGLMEQDFKNLHSLEPKYAVDILDQGLNEVSGVPQYYHHKNPSDGWAPLDPNENPQNLQALYASLVNDYDAGIDMENDAATYPALKSALRMLMQNKNIGR